MRDDYAAEARDEHVTSIGNHMRPSTIKDKLPESRSDEGNLEKF